MEKVWEGQRKIVKNREELRKERVEKGKEELERMDKGWEDREGLGRIEKG